MTRGIGNASKIDTAAKRERLEPSGAPYWDAINRTVHVGYRKGRAGGAWVARFYLRTNDALRVTQQIDGSDYKNARGRAYHTETMGPLPDDGLIADGVGVLSYDQARDAVIAMHAAAIAPAPKAGSMTVKQACAKYVDYLRAETKSGDDAEPRLANHVLPKIGDVVIAKLTTDEVAAVQNAMVKRDPDDPEVERRSKDSANRVMTYVKAAFNMAFADDANKIPSDAAWRRVKSFKKVGRPRGAFLDVAQSMRLVNATSGAFRKLVTATLLTGARPPHELAKPHVRDFDPRTGTLTVDGKTGRRDIVLTEEAIRFLKEITVGRDPDALLLPKDDAGTPWKKNDHVRPMRRAVKRAKLPKDCTIYALRHTHASQALLNGINIKFLAENMGTSIVMIEKHYGKYLAASRRQLIEESGFKLGLPKRAAKVVAFRPRGERTNQAKLVR